MALSGSRIGRPSLTTLHSRQGKQVGTPPPMPFKMLRLKKLTSKLINNKSRTTSLKMIDIFPINDSWPDVMPRYQVAEAAVSSFHRLPV